MSEVTFIGVGIACLSICVPADYTPEQIEEAANTTYPTGLESGGRWELSDDPTFSGGQTNPCDCERGPSHRHYLLNC